MNEKGREEREYPFYDSIQRVPQPFGSNMAETQNNFPKDADHEYHDRGELSIQEAYPNGFRVLVPAEPPRLEPAAGQAVLRLLIAAHQTRAQRARAPEEGS